MARMRVLCILFLCSGMVSAQDTFSIVAVDTVTREIGSAGASCVGPINGVGAYIISDVIEGVGAIHTQASWLSANQQTAHQQMLLGKSPQEIIDWMTTHDAQGNPTTRQYGVVDLTRRGQSAAYTGVNCQNYKNHATGPGYSVQGNILLGQMIIDTIKNVYLRTPGPLADRLMQALQAAKIIGADTRCASRNTSTQSSFIKVVRIGDGATPYLLKIVPDTPSGTDPIDVLRVQFNSWKDSLRTRVDPFLSRLVLDRDTLIANGTSQAVITIIPKNNSDTLLSSGRAVLLSNTGSGVLGTVADLGNGTYAATLRAPMTPGTDTISAQVISGTDTVRVAARPVVVYRSSTPVSDAGSSPQTFLLEQNFPNPFNPVTIIHYAVGSPSNVSLKVYDVGGKEILALVDGWRNAGRHAVTLDASVLASGTYYYQLRTADYIATRKMVVLR
jgi:uncharacterized Ntn-hydrolase superfamily protein